MSVFTAEVTQQIVETCQANAAQIAEPLNTNLGLNLVASVGEQHSGIDVVPERIGDVPGIAVTFQFGDEAAVCLIPETLPIPDWYRSPSEGQANQIQTLGMEWSALLFPLELEAAGFGSAPTTSLLEQLTALAPAADASVLELPIREADAEGPHCSLLLIWPLTNPVLESVAPWSTETAEDEDGQTDSATAPASVGAPAAGLSAADFSTAAARPATKPAAGAVSHTAVGAQHRDRLLKVPVNLVVQIAAKKLDVSQLRNITPGTLITFNKPCEALLDVLVADKLKFRGEAVKVGERFGIKINETNAQVVREQRVHRI